MKFKINRDHFSHGLQQVLNSVGTRGSNPILNNVLIEAAEGYVSLTTTNLDLGIRARVKAEVVVPGGLTLPVAKLASIVKLLPSLDVTVDSGAGTQARITAGGSNYRIMGLPKDEFPALPSFPDQTTYTLRQDNLATMIRSVSYAQSTDESRHIMNSVFFNFEETGLTLAATDGRRLAVFTKALAGGTQSKASMILPGKTTKEVLRQLGLGTEVKVSLNGRQAAFFFSTDSDSSKEFLDGLYLVSKVEEGVYPNYKQVIPKNSDQRFEVDRELFLESVNRAEVVTSDKNSSVTLKIQPNKVEICSLSAEFGEAQESVEVIYDGVPVNVAFNPRFIMDPLNNLPYDKVLFEFKDELSPGVLRSLDGEFLCVIMPLRLT